MPRQAGAAPASIACRSGLNRSTTGCCSGCTAPTMRHALPPRCGRCARDNPACWSGRPDRGLGPAAHSFDGAMRRWNLAAWEAYRRAVASGRSPVASQEVLTDEQRELERVYLALRTDAGLDVAALSRPLPPSTTR